MQPISSRRRWAITAGVMTGMLLAALEATIVGTAMPTIVATLGGLAQFSWVFSAYLLTSTVTVPLWGKLSDLFGRRLIYQLGIGVFLLGSAACGLSNTMTQLIMARAFQGLGAGALAPLAMTIIGDIYTLEERARMQGLFSGVWGLSSIVGPLVGGFITDQISWRWVFLINLPIGITAAVIIGLSLREPARHGKPSIDYSGAFLLTAAVTMIMLVLVESGTARELMQPHNAAIAAVAIVMLVLFVRVEKRAVEPVVPLALFRNRIVTVSIIIGFLAGVAMFGAITFVPLMAQGVLGVSATAAGSFLTPLMLSWVAASVVGGRLLVRVGSRSLVFAGLVLLLAGFTAMTFFTPTTPKYVLVLDLIMVGCGLGLTMLTLLIAAQHAVERSQLGITTSLNQFSRSIGGAMGVALLGALMSSGLAVNLTRAAAQPGAAITPAAAASLAENPTALVDPAARAKIGPRAVAVLQTSLSSALRTIFIVCAVMIVLAMVVAFRIPPGVAGSHKQQANVLDEDGERFVMAEMTTLDGVNEPEAE